MSTALIANNTDESAEMEAVLTHTIAQISEIREQMRADDVAIAQIRAENAVLKAETHTLRDETRSIIAALRIAS